MLAEKISQWKAAIASVLEAIFGKNWRTTTAGVTLAVVTAISPLLMNGNFNWKRDHVTLLLSAGLALSAALAKDAANG